MSEGHHPVHSAFSVSSATMISRIFGYVRDVLLAGYFGAGFVSDAFFVAYRIPNLLRHLLGEGALAASFIPVYSEYEARHGQEEAKKLVERVSTLLFLVLVVLSVIGIILAPQIVRLIAPGFLSSPSKYALTVTLTRILFPFLLFIGIAALAMGLLNSWRIFFLPAFAPVFLNLSTIFYLGVLALFIDVSAAGLCLSILAGAMLQMGVQLVTIRKRGFRFIALKEFISQKMPFLGWFGHPGVKKILWLMLPATIGLSVEQINGFVDALCASLLEEGSVSALYYANRIMQLPLALFGTAMSTAVLPFFSRNAAEGRKEANQELVTKSLSATYFVIIPAGVGLMIAGFPIIRLLFERGEFSSYASLQTFAALRYYAMGLFAFSGVKIVTAVFYSMKDTATPVRVGACAMAVNILLNIILMRSMGVAGLALATTLASVFNLGWLLRIAHKKVRFVAVRQFVFSLIKILCAALVMGGFLARFLSHTQSLALIIRVSGGIVSAIAFYLLAAYLMKIPELGILAKLVSGLMKRRL